MFGPLDENLKLLEAQFNVQIRTNSSEMIVEGESEDVGRAPRPKNHKSSREIGASVTYSFTFLTRRSPVCTDWPCSCC